jgi:hypothetical protein
MKLNGDGGILEITLAEIGPRGTPGDGDVLLNVTANVRNYTAVDREWVVAGAWEGFLAELRALETRRHGRATLIGASPDDLTIEFLATDSAGHMAVSGRLGWTRSDGHRSELRFGFDFEPDRLPQVLRELEAIA